MMIPCLRFVELAGTVLEQPTQHLSEEHARRNKDPDVSPEASVKMHAAGRSRPLECGGRQLPAARASVGHSRHRIVTGYCIVNRIVGFFVLWCSTFSVLSLPDRKILVLSTVCKK